MDLSFLGYFHNSLGNTKMTFNELAPNCDIVYPIYRINSKSIRYVERTNYGHINEVSFFNEYRPLVILPNVKVPKDIIPIFKLDLILLT